MSTTSERESRARRQPATPEKLGPGDWADVVKRSLRRFVEDDCLGLSQQIAYSSLLAVFPALAGLIGFLGVFHLFGPVEHVLRGTVPHGVIRFVDTLKRDSHGSAKAAALALGAVGMIWAASGATSSVIKAVNKAYELRETRPLWKVRGIAVVLVVLTGLATALVFVLIILGGDLGKVITRHTGAGARFDILWGSLRWPIAFSAIVLSFSFVYYLAPNRKQRRWKWITPGSLVGSVLWLILSALFELYVTYAGHYTKTYGTLATGVILLLWLNYSAYALLFGAELNSELDRRKGLAGPGLATAHGAESH